MGMTDRLVDLSNKPRAVVTLQLGGETFRIARVVLAARKLYGDYLHQSGELLQRAARVAELEARREAASEEDAQRIQAEIDSLAREIEASAAGQFDHLLDVLRAILEGNGYQLERQWWMEHADQGDLEGFIVESLNKDLPPDQKKTAAEAATPR